MIASLSGSLLVRGQDRVVLDVGGVGYEVLLATDTLARLPELGEPVFLHIHTQVREDAIVLFGFMEAEDREMFLTLRSVSGVGPKLALAVLSGLRTPDLCRAIVERDIKRLTSLPGIGKKTAERICVDLHEKVAHLAPGADQPTLAPAPQLTAALDAQSALVNLGYNDAVAGQALAAVKKRFGRERFGELGVSEMIREALRSLS